MSDIVLVSSWRRADYLKICLQALLDARGIEDKLVWVFQNNRRDRDIDLTDVHRVLRYYGKLFPKFQITNQAMYDGNLPGWFYSQKEALRTAYETTMDNTYFLSDDVICTPDFFEWHDAVNADGDWFGSTAWRPATGNDKNYCLQAYYVMKFPGEISMGLRVPHKSLGAMLEGGGWPSQDYMIQKQWKIVMPYVQRCYHIGGFTSHLDSQGENTGPAVDKLPNPIPDYGKQQVRFMA